MPDRDPQIQRLITLMDRSLHLTRRYMIASAVLFCISAVGFTIFLEKNRERAQDAKVTVLAIQDQRRLTLREACQDTNRRHRDALAAFDRLPPPQQPETPQQFQRRRASVAILIDALEPLQNCDRVVARATHSRP